MSFSVIATPLNTGLTVVHEAPEKEVPALNENTVPDSVVKAPVDGVPPPIAPGFANVAPARLDAFKFATFVVEATVNGAVPVARVLVIAPVALTVVNDPAAGVPLPIAAGAANVAPFNNAAFRFATFVVDATVNGAVPVARVLVIAPVALIVVAATGRGVVLPKPAAGGAAIA